MLKFWLWDSLGSGKEREERWDTDPEIGCYNFRGGCGGDRSGISGVEEDKRSTITDAYIAHARSFSSYSHDAFVPFFVLSIIKSATLSSCKICYVECRTSMRPELQN